MEDLLTISRLELGAIQLQKADIDTGDVVDHVVTLLKDKADAKGLVLEKNLAGAPRVKRLRLQRIEAFGERSRRIPERNDDRNQGKSLGHVILQDG